MTDYYSDWTDLEFIREFAKCGINYNHSHNEERLTNLLTRLDKSIQELSSKSQEYEELKNIIFLAEIALKEIRLEPTMSGSVIGNFDRKKLATEVTAFYIAYHNSKLVMPNELILLRKRCEDLESILDNNGLSWTYKKLSQ